MDKKKIFKAVGTGLIVVGAGALYFSGVTETEAAGIVAAVFVLAGVVMAIFK